MHNIESVGKRHKGGMDLQATVSLENDGMGEWVVLKEVKNQEVCWKTFEKTSMIDACKEPGPRSGAKNQ